MNFLRSIKFDAKTIGFSIVALVILAYVLFLPPLIKETVLIILKIVEGLT